MFRLGLVAACCLILSASLFSQTQGTFSGTVTDQSGSAVPKAKVTAVEAQTGNKTETVTADSGAYTLPFLPNGTYTLTAESPGFKQAVRQGLTLDAGAHPIINMTMEVGAVTEAVTVTSDSPLITASNASIGQVITTREVENLPVNGRTPLMLDTLAMGAVSTFEPGPVRPFDQPAATQVSLGGAPVGTNESLLDGAPNAGFGNQLAYSPPQDAVIEVRVNAFESDASLGHTGGGTLNQITKSGTNDFHGSLWEFNQTSFLDANSFFTNKAGQPKPPYHYNQYGLAVGGPVWIPKVFNGKNKLFWFLTYEGLKDSDPANSPLETGNPVNYATVPTAAERNGDFSALLKIGPQYQLYNPYNATQTGSTVTRQPFPNNQIPANLLNPVSQKILNYYPLPNTTGKSDGTQNFVVNAIDTDSFDNELGRLDWSIGEKDKVFVTARHNNRQQFKNPYFGNTNVAQGNLFYRINQGFTVDETHTISPTMFMDARLGWTRYIEVHSNPSDGFDLTSLGLPGAVQNASQQPQFPIINMSTCSVSAGSEGSFQCLGYNADGSDTYDAYQGYLQFIKVQGNHTLKFGTDIRDYRWSSFTKGNSAGAFTFGNSSSATPAWTNGPTTASASPTLGGDFAEFLLGLPTSGSIDNNSASTIGSQYYAFFLQDDWRAKSNLTVNLGLRYEHESPTTERYNRAVDGFNGTLANPVSGAAANAYASAYASYSAAARALLPSPAQFNTSGGLTFASQNNRSVYQTHSGYFSPRIGVAWTPSKLGGGTVIRAGFGIFVFPVEVLDNGSTSGSGGGLGTYYRIQQEGVSQTTQVPITTNNYLSPTTNLSNPFPSGVLAQGTSIGPGAFLGQGVTFFNPNVPNPYDIRWNFSIQRQLPGQIVVEVAYIGNHALRLPIVQQLDAIPRQYLDPSTTVRNAALNTLLTGSVKNPFQGLLPNSSALNGSTVALQQLLIPFPQYPVPGVPTPTTLANGVLEQGTSAGSSYFQSLDIRAQKRFTNGLTFINNFIWSKELERVSYLNDTDPLPEKRISSDSRPLREVMAFVYELPIGQNKLLSLNSRLANTLLGGWTINGDITIQSGAPLAFGNVIYYGGPLNFNAHQPNGLSFDTTQFNTVSSQQLVYNIRSFDTMFSNLRRDPTKNLDLSLLKNFSITEHSYFQLRFETFNTTNRVGFGPPQLSPTNVTFGQISTQANTPRRVQIGARLVW